MIKKIALICIMLLKLSPACADDQAIIATVYNTIVNHHLTPVKTEDLATQGLKAINSIDKNLTFANGSDMVYLYYKRQMSGLWHKPKDTEDIRSWAKITAKIIEKAAKISPRVAQQPEYVTEKVLSAAVSSLDDHSQYHLSDELDDNLEDSPISVSYDGTFLYAKIKVFGPNTATMLKNALARYFNTKAIILDLRGNPGGQLNSAIDIAKIFIDDGIILATRGRDPDTSRYYVSRHSDALNLPLAILIDKNTASSAEILAAALQEQYQAVLIGTPSYGKGSIQDTYVFDNGARLALTTAKFFTPAGHEIEKSGLMPDYCILNDKIQENTSCQRQARDLQEFDINFAKQILSEQIGN